MKTRVTDMLGIKYPIIQGGMAWVAEHHLAAGSVRSRRFGNYWRSQRSCRNCTGGNPEGKGIDR